VTTLTAMTYDPGAPMVAYRHGPIALAGNQKTEHVRWKDHTMPRLIPVIESEIPRGKGLPGDPCRTVTQYHTPEGLILAERDEWAEQERARQACGKAEA